MPLLGLVILLIVLLPMLVACGLAAAAAWAVASVLVELRGGRARARRAPRAAFVTTSEPSVELESAT
jgi:thiosulfate reductase cytochrome b subunit